MNTELSLEDVAAAFNPEPHAIVWPNTPDDVANWQRDFSAAPPEFQAKMVRAMRDRTKRLAQAKADPLWMGIEPALWKGWDEELAQPEVEFQICSGTNRSTKSYRAAKRVVEAALSYPDGFICVLGETEPSSKQIQQPLLWHFLQPHIGHLNWKTRHSLHQKVRYTPTDGFTEGVVMLPNRTRILIDTYGSDQGKWEGIEWGARVRTPVKRPDGSSVPNIGWWADESVTLDWLEMLVRRSRFRKSKGIWSFTPINGITPCLKEVLTLLRISKSSLASLLPHADVDGCPKGHMPTQGRTHYERAEASAVWVHIENNPLAEYREQIRANLKGAQQETIERIGYGYARDIIGRQFTLRSYHIIDPGDLPEVRTDYQIIDYHASRPCFAIWLGVSPGLEPWEPYIDVWCDWPDRAHFGEWAITSHRPLTADNHKGWDGERGPAQNPLNYGYAEFKAAWFEVERVYPDGPVERDPKRRLLQLQAQEAKHPIQMTIEERIIDSRAGPTKALEDHGQTCPIEKFEESHNDPKTGLKMPDFRLVPADGRRHDWNMVRELMAAPQDEAGKIMGRPRLRIVRGCEQALWALSNFTGAAGEEGACKDPIDCLEYGARGNLLHVTEGMLKVRGARDE